MMEVRGSTCSPVNSLPENAVLQRAGNAAVEGVARLSLISQSRSQLQLHMHGSGAATWVRCSSTCMGQCSNTCMGQVQRHTHGSQVPHQHAQEASRILGAADQVCLMLCAAPWSGAAPHA